MHRWRALATAAVVLGACLTLTNEAPARLTSASWTTYGHPRSFLASGRSIAGMFPGRTARMGITISNPYRFPIRVIDVRGEVVATSNRGCPPTSASLLIGGYKGELPKRLRPFSTNDSGYLPVRMPVSAARACALNNFKIQIVGTAVRAH